MKRFLPVAAIVVTMLVAATYVMTAPASADHGRTATECNRITDPADRAACQEHAKADPGGTANAQTCPEGSVRLSVRIGNTNCVGTADGGPIMAYARIIIKFLAGIVGLVAAGAIAWHLLRYITSGANPQQTADAKGKLANAVMGFALFILMVAILEAIVPGKIF